MLALLLISSLCAVAARTLAPKSISAISTRQNIHAAMPCPNATFSWSLPEIIHKLFMCIDDTKHALSSVMITTVCLLGYDFLVTRMMPSNSENPWNLWPHSAERRPSVNVSWVLWGSTWVPQSRASEGHRVCFGILRHKRTFCSELSPSLYKGVFPLISITTFW